MNILLIGSSQTSETLDTYFGEYTDFFTRAIAKSTTKANVQWSLFDDLYIQVGDGIFEITDTKTNLPLSTYDMILIRGKGFRQFFDVVRAVSRYAHMHNVPVINDYSGFRDSSKLAQAVQFYEAGLPVATTLYANRAVLSGERELPFAYPCIMKAVFGAHGNDNYLVHSLDDIRAIAQGSNLRFVLQRYIENDNDFRVLVIGEKVLVIGRKAIDGSHLNNTSQGGSAQLIPLDQLPEGMAADSIKIARTLDMTIAGVDVLIDKITGEYSFLEVNSQPQLMSGAFVDEKEALFGAFIDARQR